MTSVLVHSFAVFDCCLASLLASPMDLLFELAVRSLPGPVGREDLHEFVRLRLEAQRRAAAERGLEAPSLGMVYERFPRDNPWGLDPETLQASEIDLTMYCVRAVPPVLDMVRGLVRRGERVIYVTESLLPGVALRRLLEANGFAGEVYTAGDLGKTKQSGELFRHVLASEGLEPRQLLHRGPGAVADRAAPGRMGVRTQPFLASELTAHERFLQSRQRDCDLSQSRTVAACRLARLRDLPEEGLAQGRTLAADVVGPVLTAFVAWVLEDAARAGVEKLYFLAREGQILYRLAQTLRPAVGGPVPRYLAGSLAAWTGEGREDRRAVLAYLEQEGALDAETLAVADMGWTLSTQRALREILEERGIRVSGWYFGLVARRIGRMEAGRHRSMFIESPGQAEQGSLESLLFHLVPLLERAFTPCDHGRVEGYAFRDGLAWPVLGPVPGGEPFIREVQETALAFARAILESGWGEEAERALRETARTSLLRFLGQPEPDMVRAVVAMPHRAEGANGLLRPIGLADVVRAWLAGRFGLRLKAKNPPLWIEGSAVLGAAWLRPYLRRPRVQALLRGYFQATA